MSRKHVYLALCAPGVALPYYFMAKFLAGPGAAGPGDLAGRMFSDPWVAFLMMDLLVTAMVFLAFMFMEGRRLGMRRLWVPAMAVAMVGVSLGFPLFLYMRELHSERRGEVDECR
jgi:hypothetical protein